MMGKYTTRDFKDYETKPVSIVADAAMVTPDFPGGRFVPILILDTTARPDLETVIRIHNGGPLGDVKSSWAVPKGAQNPCLLLEFLSPIRTNAFVEFDIERQHMVVELVLRAKAFLMQGGKPGDRFYKTQDAERIFVEVGATGFEKKWDEMLFKVMRARLRREGADRWHSKKLARNYIEEMRGLADLRFTLDRN